MMPTSSSAIREDVPRGYGVVDQTLDEQRGDETHAGAHDDERDDARDEVHVRAQLLRDNAVGRAVSVRSYYLQ